MMKSITLSVALGLWALAGFGQSAYDFSGRWTVEKVAIKGASKAGVSDENCTWCGHYKNTTPLEVDKEGKVKYFFEGQAKSAKFTLVGNQLKVNFFDSPDIAVDSEVEVLSMYDFKSTPDGFVIKRSDPLVTETYEFKKLN